jgi:hypothetical protein
MTTVKYTSLPASDDIEVAPATAPAGASSAAIGVGMIVHYVLCGEAASIGQHRPAVVVRLRGDGLVDLQVITLGAEDGARYAGGYCLACNVAQDEATKAPGTWHWPETEK